MAGIYIHVPFCRHACKYCNFHFSVSRRYHSAYVDALVREIALQRRFFNAAGYDGGSERIDTLYLGGGTPSILPNGDLDTIFLRLGESFCLESLQEITLEANPDDLTPEKLSALRRTPVNRLSIGVQSFHAHDLQFLGRIHSPQQAISSIQGAMEAGFGNLNADLIYGIPGSDDAMWRDNVVQVVKMGIPHLSAYALTLEKNTELAYLTGKGKVPPLSEEQSAHQFGMLRRIMQEHGYVHYEVSNFSLPGSMSQHNRAYWTGVPYLGLGPSAHSFTGSRRSWNVANTEKYVHFLQRGDLPSEGEDLSAVQLLNEYLMTSLRTMWGCDLNKVEDGWGKRWREEIEKRSVRHLHGGLMIRDGARLVLSGEGMFFADGIAADLFLDE